MELTGKFYDQSSFPDQLFFPNDYQKPYTENEFSLQQRINDLTQDYHHHHDHHFDPAFARGFSTSNPTFGLPQIPCLDSYNPFTYPPSNDLDLFESKPVIDQNNSNTVNNGGSSSVVMQNYMSDQSYWPSYFYNDRREDVKPINFVVPDELSGVTANYVDGKEVGRSNKKSRVSSYLASPSSSSMRKRACKGRIKAKGIKGQWTLDEDRLLTRLVEQYGVRKWSFIAQMLPGRIGKQCRERWHNHLRPNIKKDVWSEEEDRILIQAHLEIGNKWAEMAKRLPGRTENSIKNHWNATKRKQLSKRKSRSKNSKSRSLLQDYIQSLQSECSYNLDLQTPNSNVDRRQGDKTLAEAAHQSHQLMNSELGSADRLVPTYESDEVPDLDFDETMFEDSSYIDSILDDLPLC